MDKVNKNVSIQLLRIMSMLFVIFGCHLFSELNSTFLTKTTQFFNVGVFIFLFIFGYLYGKKNIQDYKKWYINRAKKILIPVYIFLIIFFLLKLFVNDFSLKYFIAALLNLEYYIGAPVGIGHLCFITIILICYILTPILKKQKFNYFEILLFLILSAIGSYINSKLGQSLFYILTYFLGMQYVKVENKINIKILGLFFIFLVAIIIRLIGLRFFDGTVLYDRIIFSLTQMTICLCFFIFFNRYIHFSPNKLIDYFDSISFYLYITHYMFMVGTFRLMGLTQNLLINSIITILFAYITAVLLKKASKIVESRLSI